MYSLCQQRNHSCGGRIHKVDKDPGRDLRIQLTQVLVAQHQQEESIQEVLGMKLELVRPILEELLA